MRLIDADELKNKAYYAYPSIDHYCLSKAVIDLSDIEKAPTIEVEPVKRGRWIKVDKHTVKCSECDNYLDMRGVNAGRGDANYCPNCGADMRGGENG